jgi:hypothetical protein
MRRRVFDLTPLGHPVWWASLALLLINDNLFKGRGVVPGWLAGKLSDFAFLIVAPTLLAALLPRRVPGRRAFAVAAVVALYVAADLSRAVSDTVVAVAARVGLHWRLWPDTTDLLALAVLPITVWLLRRSPRLDRDSATARRSGVQRERAGVVLGAVACLATSAEGAYVHRPFLFNRTATSADVRITWVLRKVDCAASAETLAATLGPSDLDDPRMVTMGTGDVAALDGVPAAGMSELRLCSTHDEPDIVYGGANFPCVAAILETPGAAPVLMVTPRAWRVSDGGGFISCCDSPSPVSQCAPHLDTGRNPGDEAVSLTSRNGTLSFTLSRTGPHEEGPVTSETSIQLVPIDPAVVAARPPVADGCRETRDSYQALFGDATATCASDADCQALPALKLPGDGPTCAVFVNHSISTDALQTVEAQWKSECWTDINPNNSGPCWALPATCQMGRCAEQCAGVRVPSCPSSCSYYSDYPSGTCGDGTTCFNVAKEICTCQNSKYVCAAPPPIDPSCPLGCLSDQYVTPAFDGGVDAGTDAGASDGGDAGAATDTGSAADGLATDGGRDVVPADAGDAG